MTNRVLVFAGAGASKAVNAAQYPTTVEFFQRLPKSITQRPMFNHVLSFLKTGSPDRQVDVEEILWALHQLKEFVHAYQRESDIIGFSLAGDRIFPALGYNANQGHTSGSFRSAMSQMEQLASQLADAINEIVYDLYAHDPDVVVISENWMYLLNALSRSRTNFQIFTTNYDLVIEAAALAVNGPNCLDQFAGHSGGAKKTLAMNRWSSGKHKKPVLTKLHGSVNWQWSRDGVIHVGAPLFSGNHENHAIIYPGFKGKSELEFFDPFHSHFGNCVEQADMMIFVGFAFRDEHINDVLVDRVRQGTQVVIVNPIKVDCPIRRGKVEFIQQGFNQSSVDKIFPPQKRGRQQKVADKTLLPSAPL